MALTITDPRDGARKELATAQPGVLLWRLGADGPRERAVGELVAASALYLGLRPERREEGTVDLLVGGKGPGLRLAVQPGVPPPGADPLDLAFLVLTTPHARPLPPVAGPGREARLRWAAATAAVRGETSAPSPRALAGYLHRFREALSRDFDSASALGCVWDGLRPGALSPGSRAALLRAVGPALSLSL